MSGTMAARLVDGLVWLTLGIILLIRMRRIADAMLRWCGSMEDFIRWRRAMRKAIDAMPREALRRERRALRRRIQRETDAENKRLMERRLRVIEARMRRMQKNPPEAVARQPREEQKTQYQYTRGESKKQ